MPKKTTKPRGCSKKVKRGPVKGVRGAPRNQAERLREQRRTKRCAKEVLARAMGVDTGHAVADVILCGVHLLGLFRSKYPDEYDEMVATAPMNLKKIRDERLSSSKAKRSNAPKKSATRPTPMAPMEEDEQEEIAHNYVDILPSPSSSIPSVPSSSEMQPEEAIFPANNYFMLLEECAPYVMKAVEAIAPQKEEEALVGKMFSDDEYAFGDLEKEEPLYNDDDLNFVFGGGVLPFDTLLSSEGIFCYESPSVLC